MPPFLTEENLRWKKKAHDVAEQVVRIDRAKEILKAWESTSDPSSG